MSRYDCNVLFCEVNEYTKLTFLGRRSALIRKIDIVLLIACKEVKENQCNKL
jgi:hypothetical protein